MKENNVFCISGGVGGGKVSLHNSAVSVEILHTSLLTY